jgi:hypothetical protein
MIRAFDSLAVESTERQWHSPVWAKIAHRSQVSFSITAEDNREP